MKQQRSGKIITVSSVAGTAPSVDGGYAHYGAAKAAIGPLHAVSSPGSRAVRGYGESHRPGVIATGRIMATVIPGSVQSNRDRAELVALRRLGTVEDCAKVVEFLATDLSDYVTGAVIPIDGGWCVDSRPPSPTPTSRRSWSDPSNSENRMSRALPFSPVINPWSPFLHLSGSQRHQAAAETPRSRQPTASRNGSMSFQRTIASGAARSCPERAGLQPQRSGGSTTVSNRRGAADAFVGVPSH